MAWKGRRGLEVNLGGVPPTTTSPNYLHELNFRVLVSSGMLTNRSTSWSREGRRTREEKGDETE